MYILKNMTLSTQSGCDIGTDFINNKTFIMQYIYIQRNACS